MTDAEGKTMADETADTYGAYDFIVPVFPSAFVLLYILLHFGSDALYEHGKRKCRISCDAEQKLLE